MRPLPSCPKPLFQGEAKWGALDMKKKKMILCSHASETHFVKKGFTFTYPRMLFQQEVDTYLIVIHSKYFSASLSLKSPVTFFIATRR